ACFDFSRALETPPPVGLNSSATLRSGGGRVDGVAEWASLDIDEHISYEQEPPIGLWGTGGVFHRFGQSIETSPGDLLTIRATFDGGKVRIWASELNGCHVG